MRSTTTLLVTLRSFRKNPLLDEYFSISSILSDPHTLLIGSPSDCFPLFQFNPALVVIGFVSTRLLKALAWAMLGRGWYWNMERRLLHSTIPLSIRHLCANFAVTAPLRRMQASSGGKTCARHANRNVALSSVMLCYITSCFRANLRMIRYRITAVTYTLCLLVSVP